MSKIKFSLLAIPVALMGFSAHAMPTKTGPCSSDEYYKYAESMGDSTPISMTDWLYEKGCLKSDKKRMPLTKAELDYIAYSDSFGDATPALSFVEFTNPKPGLKERKRLTAEDIEYIKFADRFGDATPPSFSEWKANYR